MFGICFSCLPDDFFTSPNLKDWILLNLSSKCSFKSVAWSSLFAFTCWNLWKARNFRIFEGISKPLDSVFSASLSHSIEFYHLAFNPTKTISRSTRKIFWKTPDPDWFLLKTDGSSCGNPGEAGACGLIRNEYGEWVVGFARKIGYASIIQAELWGLRDGLRLAFDKGIQSLQISVDATLVLQLLNSADSDVHPLGNIISDFRLLLQYFHRTHPLLS